MLQAKREERELQAIVDEYIQLKASMQRMRQSFEQRYGRAMRSSDSSELYKAASHRRDELSLAFPGRPWATHPDYLRLEAGDKSVGCAPMPARLSQPPSAAANMSSA